jgi:hypothetical protein
MEQQKTSRKKDKKRMRETHLKQHMISYLETKWNNTITYTCVNCLQEAYNSEINNYNGYITDEDLIKSSKYKLRHK